ncbi:hypothetical protein Mgra_00006868, partial [Meloidogyne graminicola]
FLSFFFYVLNIYLKHFLFYDFKNSLKCTTFFGRRYLGAKMLK